jgi:Domain of unknown function (DUF6265)
MKKIAKTPSRVSMLVFSVLFLLLPVACAPRIAAFKWLEGDWEMPRRKGGVLVETWKFKDAKTMLGGSMSIVGKDTTVQESVRLFYKDKQFWYESTVPDQNDGKPIAFKMVRAEAGKFVFENPKHDFPQRIVYRFCPPVRDPAFKTSQRDTLRARVESLDGKGMDFTYLRR